MLEFGLAVGADTEVWPAEQDYCSWNGVVCDDGTISSGCDGKVITLQLPMFDDDTRSLTQSLLLDSPCLQSIDVSTGSRQTFSEVLSLLQLLPPNINLMMGDRCCEGDGW